jgi:hypothetical protein
MQEKYAIFAYFSIQKHAIPWKNMCQKRHVKSANKKNKVQDLHFKESLKSVNTLFNILSR